MLQALLYGLLASAAFPLGVAIGLLWRPPRRFLAAVIAFGAGVLVSALSFELMQEALETGALTWTLGGFLAGAFLYITLDQTVDHFAKKSPRREGHEAKQVKPDAAQIPETETQATVSGMAVLVGTALDGIPENAAIGVGLAADKGPGLGLVLLGAVFLSNLPGALTSTIGMRQAGRSVRYVLIAWTIVSLACVASVVVGYGVLAGMPDRLQGALLALAAGSIIAMLADTMFPDAFRTGGPWTAMATALGFALAAVLSRLAS